MTVFEQFRFQTDDALPLQVVSTARAAALVRALRAEREHVDGQLRRLVAIRDLTRQVRAAQRRYFAVRDKVTLREAQHLERQLDELLDPAPMLPGMEAPR